MLCPLNPPPFYLVDLPWMSEALYNHWSMDNFRMLDHKDEIFQMVKKAPVVEIGEIWQTLPMRREVYKINSLEVLSEAMIFSTTLPFEFEKNYPIYIKINFKNLIFKLMPNEFKTYNNQLSCTYPKEAKALESRTKDRTRLPKKSNMSLILRTFHSGNAMDVKVSIDDISDAGLGIKANAVNAEYFHKSSVFKIIKVCGKNHMEECTLTVRHVSQKDKGSFISIGLSADKSFSDEMFTILRENLKRGLQLTEAPLEIT